MADVKIFSIDPRVQQIPTVGNDSVLAREVVVDGHRVHVMIYARHGVPTNHLITVARCVDLLPTLCAFPNSPES